jgi:hypothetical protein
MSVTVLVFSHPAKRLHKAKAETSNRFNFFMVPSTLTIKKPLRPLSRPQRLYESQLFAELFLHNKYSGLISGFSL